MKKLFKKIKASLKSFFEWVWMECKDWRTLVLLGIVCVVLGLPVWGGYILFFIFSWNWAFWVASVCWAFWMLPGAPFFALSVSITLIIKRFYEKHIKKIGGTDPNGDNSHTDTSTSENGEDDHSGKQE